MANPVVTAVSEGSWVIVVTDTLAVTISPLIRGVKYSWTYRDTGDPSPTLASEQIEFVNSISISADAGIDIYVWAKNGDGSVRVDDGIICAWEYHV